MKKIILLTLFVFSFSILLHAQTTLSQDDLQDYHNRIGQMIESFQNKLSIIGSKEKSFEVKKVYIRQTLELFMGRGSEYTDIYGNILPPVMMELSSLNGGYESKRSLPVKSYLNNLSRISYAKVDITSAETYHLSDIYQVGDHFEATATIFQKFTGYCNREGRLRPCYSDVTKKTIKIFIIPEEDMYGKHWTAKFGDISVAETSN